MSGKQAVPAGAVQPEVAFTPIGKIVSPLRKRYESPRQGVLAGNGGARLHLQGGMNFEQALTQLEEFSRIWLIYVFHLNHGWRRKANIPGYDGPKPGVFASRAPYRPNAIGLSCVVLKRVDGLVLELEECDLLNGTPVLDIKPYLPYSDAFPDAGTAAYVHNRKMDYRISYTPDAEAAIAALAATAGIDLRMFINTQLSNAPLNGRRKRVKPAAGGAYELAYEKLRISFIIDVPAKLITITGAK